ncbi:TetR family transcriptional regulator [Halococcus morrhuae DSM 1307]|uniref:TetR family transcriptional regulator n=1 Tax=Halococcus morrhuae DSM 1307 TaxID=931277 RepID=M0M9L8_HALMO|nr:TetR/AcrR family transcriptional regulator [Halococcus morrhuae]EMA41339.1 TetR family transcriptional regulator [Halococcus morrhuae DSM 1307]
MSETNADDIDTADGAAEQAESGTANEAIMEATYRALCTHGAADLSVQAIADEFDKSKSLIFYHYDSREDLLSSFLAYLLENFKNRVAASEITDPVTQLDGLIDSLLYGPDDNESFQIAMLELRSQAPFNEAYREQFRRNRAHVHRLTARVIDCGIDDGVFAPVDPDYIATLLLTMIDGARLQLVVLGDETILDTTRAAIDDRLDATLFAEQRPSD